MLCSLDEPGSANWNHSLNHYDSPLTWACTQPISRSHTLQSNCCNNYLQYLPEQPWSTLQLTGIHYTWKNKNCTNYAILLSSSSNSAATAGTQTSTIASGVRTNPGKIDSITLILQKEVGNSPFLGVRNRFHNPNSAKRNRELPFSRRSKPAPQP